MAQHKGLSSGEEFITCTRESFWFMWPKVVFTLTLYFWWWRKKRLELTTKRLIFRKGLLSRTERSVRLENVLDVEVRRSLLGRIFGYGAIDIETAASGRAEFGMRGCSHPGAFRDALIAAQERQRAEEAERQRREMAQMVAAAQAAAQQK
jgi:uncharacterized membrane protein YdbT with pleckstrin-like domain